MPALRPQLQIVANRHNAMIAACHERLDRLTDAQLRWKPDDKTWSIVLVVDHLIKVHTATSPLLMKVLQPAPAAGDEGQKDLPYSFIERKYIQFISPGSKVKFSVPKLFEPVAHRAAAANTVQRLYDEFDAFSIIVEYADAKRLKGLHVRHPAAPISLSALACMDAITQHNKYHWLQVEALLRNREFPAP